MEIPSREIMWNVSSVWNVISMYSLFTLSALIGLAGVLRHAEIVIGGSKDKSRTISLTRGCLDMFSWVGLQKGVLKERTPGIAHTLIYLGFLTLTFTTTMVMLDHDFGLEIYQGNFYLLLTLLSDVLGLGFLFGLAIMAHRRYILAEKKLHNTFADSFFLLSLTLLIIQGFILEGLRIHVTTDQWALWSPVGLLTAKFFWFLSDDATILLHFLTWWFHTLTVFSFFAIAPYTKFFHVLASSLNLFFKTSGRPKGTLPSPGDIEKLMETEDEFTLGIGNIKDYSWKQLLDLEACTSCGRCQDVCPAYTANKPLSPKWLILDTRNHVVALHANDKLETSKSITPQPFKRIDQWFQNSFALPSQGIKKDGDHFSSSGSYRGENLAVQDSVLALGKSADDRIAGEVMSSDVFWSCTTCMACVEACPVGINHVEQIVENRRNMVLMEGEIPSEAQSMLRALENRGNPFGPAEDRSNWATELNVPIVKAGDSVDYLYWVGCVTAYDPRKQKIAQALVKIMEAAGLSFGILGSAEACTGDPARRVGEENLFQSLAKSNLEMLKSIRFKHLVANCPHCFNSIKNDYPEFGNLGDGEQPEIIHHSNLLQRLLAEGKIELQTGVSEKITFHDPCYLGRYNEEYKAPRDTLKSVKSLQILEMTPNKEKGLCCGAGGGHFWMDDKSGERINVIRTEQAVATGADKIATACPFCLQMMEDGVKLTDREETHQVKDIAEVIYENLKSA
jgi:Fe-S oxidoreductase/nitrate reductase gamma subunit